MKLTVITAIAMLLFFSPSSWGVQSQDSNYEVIHLDEENEDCNATYGVAADNSVAFEHYCHRRSDFKQVKTVAGMLMIKGERELWLGDKKLAAAKWVTFGNGVPERHFLPSVFTVNLSPVDWTLNPKDVDKGSKSSLMYLHLVDVGVTPPFISEDALPVIGIKHDHGRRSILLEKLDNGADWRNNPEDYVYIMVGESRTEKDKDGNPVLRAYKYDRKTRTITKL